MKRKLLSTVVALSMTASMTMPVFAAANNQNSQVPVTGKIGRWNPGTTNPDGSGGGSGQNNEVQPPQNVTDINVTVPTSMTFNVVTNTTDSNPELATVEYTVTNNGQQAVNMTGAYNVVDNGGITLVDSVTAPKGGDGKVELALGLNAGQNADTPFIEHVTSGAQSAAPVEIAATNGSTKLKFTADAAGMADVKAEAQAGTFKDAEKVTKGNLVLTFQAK